MSTTALQIRRVVAADAAALARLMGEPSVQSQTLQLPWPTAEQWQARLAEKPAPGQADLVLVAERGGEVVGNAGLHSPTAAVRRRHAAALGIAVSAAAQGQGVGHALVQALVDYADRWTPLLRIELTVYADNERAIRLYRRFGFETEGRHRAFALRDGIFVDALAMARLHPNPPRWTATP